MKWLLRVLLFSTAAVAQSNISPNMLMPIPIPGVTPGPEWASDINRSFTIIDQHNHSTGRGVPVQPNGLNINSDLTFQSHNAIALRTTRFTTQAAILTAAADKGELYVVGNELYYNDVTGGNKIAITSNGSVNAGAGSITGLPSGTAGVSYSGGTYVFQSATNTAANIDGESFILRNSSASSNGLTLNPPAAMGSNFSLTLPSLPASQKIMTLDASGNMAAPYTVDGTTIAISANVIGIPTGAITNTQLAAGARQIHKALLDTTGTTTFTTASTISTSTVFKVTAIGGGGSGGSGGAGSTGGGGGGGGATAVVYVSGLSASTGYPVIVGLGGASVSGGASNVGLTGGTTSFSSYASAGGGLGGKGTAAFVLGGAGGTATVGDILMSGCSGSGGYNVSALTNNGGAGGCTTMGGGGIGGHGAVAGGVGGNYGGGGGGSSTGSSGAGAPGVVLIEWNE